MPKATTVQLIPKLDAKIFLFFRAVVDIFVVRLSNYLGEYIHGQCSE